MKIEKNIPIPECTGKYDWSKFDVGDSVFFDEDSWDQKIRSSAAAYGKRKEKKFSGKKVDGGYRIWRIE